MRAIKGQIGVFCGHFIIVISFTGILVKYEAHGFCRLRVDH